MSPTQKKECDAAVYKEDPSTRMPVIYEEDDSIGPMKPSPLILSPGEAQILSPGEDQSPRSLVSSVEEAHTAVSSPGRQFNSNFFCPKIWNKFVPILI